MSENQPSTDINESHRKFWKEHDPMIYPDSIVGATFALEMYEAHGHGRFIWEAYKHFRLAEKHWPMHKKTLEDAYPANVVNDSVIKDLRDRVMPLVDAVFDDLLALRETSDDAGNKALKKALKIDGRKAPVNSVARSTDTQIVESMMMMYRHLASLQDRYRSDPSRMPGPPPASATHIKGIVARQTGASVSKIDAVWRDYLCDGQHAEYCRELIDHCKRVDKDLRPPRRKQKASKRSPARPAADHVWRTTIKKV
jgi:hypothetical protein